MPTINSYEMWVPKDKLYDFLELINENSVRDGNVKLHWPDGKTLDFCGQDHPLQQTKHIALDSSFTDFIFTYLLFDSDEYLSTSKYEFLHSFGKYLVGSICLYIDLAPRHGWLDGEPEYAVISFENSNEKMSYEFSSSPSVRKFFTDLARGGGAISCVLKCELGTDILILLDGKEFEEDRSYDEGFTAGHLRDSRNFANPDRQIGDREKRLLLCQQTIELSQHDLMARIEWAQFDEDSGVRAAAFQSLAPIDSIEIEELLCKIAREDKDWRVRCVATSYLKERQSESSRDALFKALSDENFQVRIAAIEALNNTKWPDEELATALEPLIGQLACHGESMGAFLVAMNALSRNGEARHAEIIRNRMSEPDFPFEWEAQQAIERLERDRSVKPRPLRM